MGSLLLWPMTNEQISDEDLLFHKLNQETGQINWIEIQRYFARGVVVVVSKDLDLVKTAEQISLDQDHAIQSLIGSSKIHRATITCSDPDYEGSIEIPSDLMRAAGLWEKEKVLVASITTGARLETYVQTGAPGTGRIVMNGGAARMIGKGETVTIMAFGWSDRPVPAKVILCNRRNEVIRKSHSKARSSRNPKTSRRA